MKEIKAKLSYLRISPRKVRLVADMVRRKKTDEAISYLSFTPKKGCRPVLKLLESAIANARNNFSLNPGNLYISKITVDEGPKLKRFMPRARGSASPIQKKTSHITLVLKEIIPGQKIEKKEVKAEKIIKTGKEKKEITKPKFDSNKKDLPKQEVKGMKRVFRRKSV